MYNKLHKQDQIKIDNYLAHRRQSGVKGNLNILLWSVSHATQCSVQVQRHPSLTVLGRNCLVYVLKHPLEMQQKLPNH